MTKLLLFFFVSSLSFGTSFEELVLAGDPISPNSNIYFDSFSYVAPLSKGKVVFMATTTDGLTGLYAGKDFDYIKLVDTETKRPNRDENFTYLSALTTDGKNVGFQGSGKLPMDLYSVNVETKEIKATIEAGAAPKPLDGMFSSLQVAQGGDGNYFSATYQPNFIPGSAPLGSSRGLFKVDGKSVKTIVLAEASKGQYLYAPVVDPTGGAAYVMGQYVSGVNELKLMHRDSTGNLKELVAPGAEIEGIDEKIRTLNTYGLSVYGGRVSFIATMTPSNKLGLFVYENGKIKKVFSVGEVGPSGLKWNYISSAIVCGDALAVYASEGNRYAIYLFKKGKAEKVLAVGDTVFGERVTSVILYIGSLSKDSIVFKVSLSNGIKGLYRASF